MMSEQNSRWRIPW